MLRIISTRCYFSILCYHEIEMKFPICYPLAVRDINSKLSCTFQGNIFLRDNGGPTKIMLHIKSDFVNTSLLHYNEFLVIVRNVIRNQVRMEKQKCGRIHRKQGLEVIVYRTSKLWAIFARTQIWTHYLATHKNAQHTNV